MKNSLENCFKNIANDKGEKLFCKKLSRYHISYTKILNILIKEFKKKENQIIIKCLME